MNPWRLINPIISLLARSPLHFVISHQLLVVSFTGAKSGKQYLVPLSYHIHSSSYTCVTLRSNIWWRNLKSLTKTFKSLRYSPSRSATIRDLLITTSSSIEKSLLISLCTGIDIFTAHSP